MDVMKKFAPFIAVLALAACGGTTSSADTTVAPDTTAVATSPTNPNAKVAAPTVIDVTVGENSGESRSEEVALGAEVTLNITNPDADDEFHLHGYDLGTGATKKGETASISFTADKAGTFEVESHVTEELILTITVK